VVKIRRTDRGLLETPKESGWRYEQPHEAMRH